MTRAWQISPSRGMARLSQRLLNININTDFHPSTSVLGAGPPRSPLSSGHSPSSPHLAQTRNSYPTSESDNSSIIGDLLPDEQEEELNLTRKKNTQIAVHLASWLAHRTGSDLEAVYPEIAEIISAYSLPENGPLQAMCFEESTKPLSAQIETAVIATEYSRTKPLIRYKLDGIDVEAVGKKHKNQRLRFSFLPGDDVHVSRVTGSHSNSLSAFSSKTKPGWYDTEMASNSKDNGRARESFDLEGRQGTSAGPADGGRTEPQREDSNRSVLTAINNGSYSGSTGSLRVSTSSGGTAKKSNRVASTTKKDSFAAAAARMAGQNKAEPK